jgi:hypothetical protein
LASTFGSVAASFDALPNSSERSSVSTELLAVAHGVERRRPRAEGAEPDIAQPGDYTAGRHELPQIGAELLARRIHRVVAGQREWNAVLQQVVAGRHLAAERVAAVGDGHQAGLVGEGLHEHRHVEAGPPQGVRDGPLVAEVRQGDDHAGNPLPMLLEQLGALRGILERLDAAVFRVGGRERHHLDTFGFEDVNHGPASGLAEMVGEEPPVADDETQHELVHDASRCRQIQTRGPGNPAPLRRAARCGIMQRGG